MGFGAPGGLEHRDPAQGLGADVEHQRVPVGRDDVVGPALQAPAPEVGAGRPGWLGDGQVDLGVGGEALQPEAGGEALVGAQVVVLQGQGGQAGRVPGQVMAVLVGLEQTELGHPVELVGEGHGVGLESGEDLLPPAEDRFAGTGARHSRPWVSA